MFTMGQIITYPDCNLPIERGKSHNSIFNRIIFTGTNTDSLNRLFLISAAQNLTFSNSIFKDFKLSDDNYGFAQGYFFTEYFCPNKLYFQLLYENNVFINTGSSLSATPTFLTGESSFKNMFTRVIFRGNTYIN